MITKELTSRKEFILNGEVFRRIPEFPKYHISDRGTVVSSATSNPKILKGRRYTAMSLGNGYIKVMKNDLMCCLAFDGK